MWQHENRTSNASENRAHQNYGLIRLRYPNHAAIDYHVDVLCRHEVLSHNDKKKENKTVEGKGLGNGITLGKKCLNLNLQYSEIKKEK